MNLSKTIVIFNPKSGRWRKLKTQELASLGEMWVVGKDGTVEELAEKAGQSKMGRVVVCGGDGSVQKALAAAVKYKFELGIFPMGTGNVLAQNLGIPLDLPEAARVAMNGEVKEMDLGKVNGEYFALSASVGIVAEVMRKTKRKQKKIWGMAAYMFNLILALGKRSKKYRVSIDGKETFVGKARGILIANVATMLGVHAESGDLRVGILRTESLWSWLDFIGHLITRKVYESKYLDVFIGKEINIEMLGKPQRFECDGSGFGHTQRLEIKILSSAIKIIVPNSEIW